MKVNLYEIVEMLRIYNVGVTMNLIWDNETNEKRNETPPINDEILRGQDLK